MKRTGFKSTAPGLLRLATNQGRICVICKIKPTNNAMASVCSQRCAIKKGKLDKAAAKKDLARRKEALKTRNDWIADVQVVFNQYIRARDAGKPCICCGKPFEPQKIGGSVDAGHYRSRGSAPHLRFDERNVHAQRKNCNRPGGTTHDAFRAGMEARIGREALEALECDQASRDWTIEDLKALKAHYRAKLKEFNRG